MQAFITQDATDRDFLVRNMRSFNLPVLNVVDERQSRVPFKITEEVCISFSKTSCLMLIYLLIWFSCYYLPQMRMLGIHSRLDQVFDAPDAVKEVLINQFGLDSSVGLLF